MQDRFRFRLFDTRIKRMVYNIEQSQFNYFQNGYDLPLLECAILDEQNIIKLMQCVGLKDKNGKLIFEGDIVRQSDGCLGFIVWQGISYWIESPGSHARDLEHIPYYESVEVIGNIYENPELLEE